MLSKNKKNYFFFFFAALAGAAIFFVVAVGFTSVVGAGPGSGVGFTISAG
jgi:hypothetical protein